MKVPGLRLTGLWPWLGLLAAGLLAGGRLGAAVVGVAGVAGVLAVFAALAPGRAVRATLRRTLPAEPPSAGDDIEICLGGELALGWPLVLTRLEDVAPPPLRPASGHWTLGGGLSASVRLHAVPRGVYRFAACRIALRDGLGLVERTVLHPLPGELLIYPRRIALSVPDRRPHAHAGEEVVRSTRDFLPGDRPSRLHGARTAQRGFPQVRESTPPPAEACTLRLFAPGAPPDDAELAISALASLAEALAAGGHAVGLSIEGACLPPAPGPQQRPRILRELAQADAGLLAAADSLPPLPDGHGDDWLVLAGAAATQPNPPRTAVLLRVGRTLGGDGITSLADLAAWASRVAP